MQGEKTGLQEYAEDKPERTEEHREDKETCLDCPYGRHSPCIGFCLLKIIREMNLKV